MTNWMKQKKIHNILFLFYTVIIFLYILIDSFDFAEGGIFSIQSALLFNTTLYTGDEMYPIELSGGMGALQTVGLLITLFCFYGTFVLILINLTSLFIKPSKMSLILNFLLCFLVLGFIESGSGGQALLFVPCWLLLGYSAVLIWQYWRLSMASKHQTD